MYTQTILIGGAIAAILLLVLIGIGFKHLMDRVENLSMENQAVKDQISLYQTNDKALREGLEQWEAASKDWQNTIDQLQANDTQTEEKIKVLHGIFSKHNLEKLSKRKPGLIESRANRASIKHIRLLECTTRPGGCKDEKSTQYDPAFPKTAGP